MSLFAAKKQSNETVTDFIELDKAGIIYPYVAKKDWNSVYRIEAKLSSPLDFFALRKAARIMREKYPYFFMTIAKKDRRFVLAKADSGKVLVENIYPICRPFDLESRKPLTRIIYDKDTIAVEMFHVLADGHGGVRFFKELLNNYRRNLLGISLAAPHRADGNDFVYDLSDIYEEFAKEGGKSVSRILTRAYQFKTQPEAPLTAKCIDVSLDSLKKTAKRMNATVTEFLCAVQIAAIFEAENTKNKTVRISVPVDIRRFAQRETGRNGALYILVSMKKSNALCFNDILESVKKQFKKYLTKENMLNLAYTNVAQSKMKAFDILPLALKKVILNFGFTALGEDQFTSTLTNIGIINLGTEFDEIVKDAYFVLGKQKTKPINIAVSTFKNSARLMVSSVYENERLTEKLISLLKDFGITSPTESAGSSRPESVGERLAS